MHPLLLISRSGSSSFELANQTVDRVGQLAEIGLVFFLAKEHRRRTNIGDLAANVFALHDLFEMRFKGICNFLRRSLRQNNTTGYRQIKIVTQLAKGRNVRGFFGTLGHTNRSKDQITVFNKLTSRGNVTDGNVDIAANQRTNTLTGAFIPNIGEFNICLLYTSPSPRD